MGHLLFMENPLGFVYMDRDTYTFKWRFVHFLRLLKTPTE